MESLTFEQKQKLIKDQSKAYKYKLKRHKDSILSLYSENGIDSKFLISGSVDHTCRVWNLVDQKITKSINIKRPPDNEIQEYSQSQMDVVNYTPGHILNRENLHK